MRFGSFTNDTECAPTPAVWSWLDERRRSLGGTHRQPRRRVERHRRSPGCHRHVAYRDHQGRHRGARHVWQRVQKGECAAGRSRARVQLLLGRLCLTSLLCTCNTRCLRVLPWARSPTKPTLSRPPEACRGPRCAPSRCRRTAGTCCALSSPLGGASLLTTREQTGRANCESTVRCCARPRLHRPPALEHRVCVACRIHAKKLCAPSFPPGRATILCVVHTPSAHLPTRYACQLTMLDGKGNPTKTKSLHGESVAADDERTFVCPSPQWSSPPKVRYCQTLAQTHAVCVHTAACAWRGTSQRHQWQHQLTQRSAFSHSTRGGRRTFGHRCEHQGRRSRVCS